MMLTCGKKEQKYREREQKYIIFEKKIFQVRKDKNKDGPLTRSFLSLHQEAALQGKV